MSLLQDTVQRAALFARSDRAHHHRLYLANETTGVENSEWVVIGDTVILTLTLVGSFYILGTMGLNELKGRSATVRMRLVQSLILSDVVMGFSGLAGCGLFLSGHEFRPFTPACDGLGVIFAAVIFSQHLWTLALAFATFMILIHPLHYITNWIEKHWYWSWLAVWVISFAVSVLGYLLYGYEPSGGICFYGNDSGVFGELIQFLPRAIVFICIGILYGRLFVFLKRPDTIRTGYSENSDSWSRMKKGSWLHPSAASRGRWFRRGQRTVIVNSQGDRLETNMAEVSAASAASSAAASAAVSAAASASGPSACSVCPEGQLPKPMPPPLIVKKPQPVKTHCKRNSRQSAQQQDDIPPWERVELPAFQVDGQRFGGPQVPSTLPTPLREPTWNDWRGFGASRKRLSTCASGSTRVGSDSPVSKSPLSSPTRDIFDAKIAQSMQAAGANGAVPSQILTRHPNEAPSAGATPPGSATTAVDPALSETTTVVGGSPGSRKECELKAGSCYSFSSGVAPDEWKAPTTAPTPIHWNQDSSPFGSGAFAGFTPEYRRPSLAVSAISNISAISELSSTPSGPASAIPPARRVSLVPHTIPGSRPGTPKGSISEMPRVGTPWGSTRGEINPSDAEKGLASDSDGLFVKGGYGSSGSTSSNNDPCTCKDDKDDGNDLDLIRFLRDTEPPQAKNDPFVVTNQTEQTEYHAESMASYLNRKTALLMLWFPLGYVILFSVSTIKIIYDFTGSPPASLRALSRWMIFGQGLLDGIIYGIVEIHTKRVVRKHVRKGTFSPTTSHGRHSGSALASGLRGLGGHSWRAKSPDPAGQTATTTSERERRRDNASPTVSFADPERSILQRLDEGEEDYGLARPARAV